MKEDIRMVFFSLLCLASSGVWAQPNTKVTGKLKGLEAGTMIYLWPLNATSKKDSVVAAKGKFEFNLSLEEGDRYSLTIGTTRATLGHYISFYLQPGVVTIKGKAFPLYEARLSGSQFIDDQNDLKNFMKNAEELQKFKQFDADYSKAVMNRDTVKLRGLSPKYTEKRSVEKKLYEQWFMDHPASPVSAMVLEYDLNEKNLEKMQQLLDHLQPEAKQNALVKQLQHRIEVANTTAVGKPAPDFVQNDTLGKPVALKDFRGKYVLIDFWASWCVPCRKENPNVVKAYNNFRDKNFTVLGVSLDQPNGKEKWLKAIHDDNLTWTHVSDLKFWDNVVAKLYGIKGVPANLLIGPDGVILAKNLRGEDLEEQLRKFIR